MSTIKLYPNLKSSPQAALTATGTPFGVDKVGLDVNIANSVSGSFRPSGLITAGRITNVSIDDTQWYAAPPTALTDRNNIAIQNQSTTGAVMIVNFSNSAGATEGFQVPQGGSRSLSVTDAIPVYVRTLSGVAVACVEELA